jgi:hypothetical protein
VGQSETLFSAERSIESGSGRVTGIGGHHRPYRGAADEWLTPPEIVRALGPFDLDPCAAVGQPWRTAKTHYTVEDDGLSKEWFGLVWCNPPYGPVTWRWLERLAEHGSGIALTFARTETEGFFAQVWERADAMLFLRGRLYFHYPDGTRASANSGGPSVLVAYGDLAVERLRHAVVKLPGAFVARAEGSANVPVALVLR